MNNSITHNPSTYQFTAGKNDECYTPDYGVTPILKHIPKNAVVWCPFDKSESEFVKQISLTHKVIFSHLDDDKNFFDYEPDEHWDVIVSNPPFTNKRKFFERALELNKPFAFLMTLACFNDKYPAWSFHEHSKEMQLLKFDKRMEFKNQDPSQANKITFQSGYICCDFLKSGLILESLDIEKKSQRHS